jgi:methionyl-tRNA formyltransferase
VVAVITQPDKPAGRGGAPTPTPVGAWAAEQLAPAGVPVLKPPSVNQPDVTEQLRALGRDGAPVAWVVIAFGQKLGKRLLDGVFAINLHASLLPRWRGAAPIHAAVLAGDAVTGNSVITLADRKDAGLVLGQSHRPLGADQTTGELHDLLAADGPALVLSVLAAHASGTVTAVAQDEALVTIAPKLSKSDGWVDYAQPADLCRRRIHGLTPWPGVTSQFRAERLKVLRAAIFPTGAGRADPGVLVDATAGIVACGQGTAIQLLEVQPAGKRAMAWRDFAAGRRPTAGDRFVGGAPETTPPQPSGSSGGMAPC